MSQPIRILELRSVRGTGGGPEKTILLGAAGSDPSRFLVTVCYLRVEGDPLFAIDERAASLGVDYVDVNERHSLDVRIWKQLRTIVRERHIHIVHAHDYKTDLLALLLARAEGVMPLTTVHGWTGHSSIERHVYYPADKLLIGRFPIAIAVSSEIRAELLRWRCRPERIRVVLNGIDHRAFRRERARVADSRRSLGLLPEQFAIGAVGRLEPQKRFDLLVEAFAEVSLVHPEARLLIAGEGSARGEIEAAIARHGVGDRCTLLGHCADIASFHHALDLFVQSSDYEGTPNVVLEAMAFESPVVVTSVGGTAELVRDGIDGLLVPPGSAARLGAAILEAMNNPAATAARKAAARARVETDLSFETRMRTVEAIYEELSPRMEGGRRTNRRGAPGSLQAGPSTSQAGTDR